MYICYNETGGAMEILKIKSNSVFRYGIVFYRRDNQRFLDIHFRKVTYLIAFSGVAK